MSDTVVRRLRPWLGTYVAIEARGTDPDRITLAIEAAYADIAAIHAALSFHSAASELARMNRHAHQETMPVGWHTWVVLSQAILLAQLSDGLFDPTVAPRLVRHGALPAPIEAPTPDPTANWRHIELTDPQQVRFHRPLWLDLGGIAKGYAIDCAIDTLRAHGLSAATVNAGGDLRAFGPLDGAGVPLAVRAPANPADAIPLGVLRNRAAATSGDFYLGRPNAPEGLSPILHPTDGARPACPRSVTVIADECITADGLTKIVSLAGTEAEPLLAHFGATAAIIEPPDQLIAADGFWTALGHPHPPETAHVA